MFCPHNSLYSFCPDCAFTMFGTEIDFYNEKFIKYIETSRKVTMLGRDLIIQRKQRGKAEKRSIVKAALYNQHSPSKCRQLEHCVKILATKRAIQALRREMMTLRHQMDQTLKFLIWQDLDVEIYTIGFLKNNKPIYRISEVPPPPPSHPCSLFVLPRSSLL